METIDPLFKVKMAFDKKLIDKRVFDLISKRKKIADDGILKIKKLTDLDYPPYFIDPTLTIATSPLEYEQFSILYARTIPFSTNENKVKVFIQLSAPLLIYGLKGTIIAILAHEFLHYLEILKRIINVEIISDNINNSLFENEFTDNERLFNHSKIFKKDRYLLKTINMKFQNGFCDDNLNKKTIKFWIEKKLPVEKILIENNYTKIPFLAITNTNIDDSIKEKIMEFL